MNDDLEDDKKPRLTIVFQNIENSKVCSILFYNIHFAKNLDFLGNVKIEVEIGPPELEEFIDALSNIKGIL